MESVLTQRCPLSEVPLYMFIRVVCLLEVNNIPTTWPGCFQQMCMCTCTSNSDLKCMHSFITRLDLNPYACVHLIFSYQTPGATQATTATQAPVELLVKFLERLYRTLPLFCSVANSQEFIEALAATLFPLPLHPAPPPPPSNGGPGGREGDQEEIAEIDDEEVGLVKDCVYIFSIILSHSSTVRTTGQRL